MKLQEGNVIIQRIREGDTRLLSRLYRENQPKFLGGIIKRYRCHPCEAEDLYHEAIIQFVTNIETGKLKELTSSVGTYLFGIGKYKYLEKRKEDVKVVHGQNLLDIPEIMNTELRRKEQLLQLVEKSLDLLGPPGKTVLELYYFHNYTMDQIAEAMGYKNSDSTKNQKLKFLKRLRKIFNEELVKELLKHA